MIDLKSERSWRCCMPSKLPNVRRARKVLLIKGTAFRGEVK